MSVDQIIRNIHKLLEENGRINEKSVESQARPDKYARENDWLDR